jgi:hypothetical protein
MKYKRKYFGRCWYFPLTNIGKKHQYKQWRQNY